MNGEWRKKDVQFPQNYEDYGYETRNCGQLAGTVHQVVA